LDTRRRTHGWYELIPESVNHRFSGKGFHGVVHARCSLTMDALPELSPFPPPDEPGAVRARRKLRGDVVGKSRLPPLQPFGNCRIVPRACSGIGWQRGQLTSVCMSSRHSPSVRASETNRIANCRLCGSIARDGRDIPWLINFRWCVLPAPRSRHRPGDRPRVVR